MTNRIWILQIADLHLLENDRNELTTERCISLISKIVHSTVKHNNPLAIALCGDLTTKGEERGYNLSIAFCRELQNKINRALEILVCPGNHDIDLTSNGGSMPFGLFNRYVWQIGQVEQFSNKTSVIIKEIASVKFFLVNSVFHLNHSYGEVDIDSLLQALNEERKPCDCSFVLIHHPIIPTKGDKQASIRNAQEFLQVCLAGGIKGILHGHGHMETILSVGYNLCPIVGVSSLFSSPRPNYNNEFNLVLIEHNRLAGIKRFRFLADRIGNDGTIGSFVPTDVRII